MKKKLNKYKKKKNYEQYKRQQLEFNLIKKEKLCGVIENLIEIEDRALLYRLTEEAKKKWYKLQDISENNSNQINKRFFNALKECEKKCSDYIHQLHGNKNKNYERKVNLIEQFKKF